MNAFILSENLRSLDPNFLVDTKHTHTDTNKDLGSCGIYYKEEYIAWCTVKHIPLGTQHNKDRTIKAPGLREILSICIRKASLSPYKVAAKFSMGLIGQSDWDKMNSEEKYLTQFPKNKKEKIDPSKYIEN